MDNETNKDMSTALTDLLSKIVENNSGESEAISDYYELLSCLEELEDDTIGDMKVDDIEDTIREIISDEMNHREKLTDIERRLSDITAATD